MSSIIANAKYGDCSRCHSSNTDVRKRKKDLVCLRCCEIEDKGKQLDKAKLKNAGRSLMNYQRTEGKEDDASRQNLMNELDYVFSRVVRLRGINENGFTCCYTCDCVKHWSMLQCGHYQKRGNTLLRLDFRNARIQCKNCNENLGGNYDEYTKRMEEESPGLPEQLQQEAREPHKWYIHELKELLIDLRSKLRPLELKIKQFQT